MDIQGKTKEELIIELQAIQKEHEALKVSHNEYITQLKRAEEFVNKQKEIMTQAEELAELGSWEWDIKRDSWTISDNWKKIHGITDTQLTTRQLLPIAHPEDRYAIEEAFRMAVENGKPYEIQHRIIRQDTKEIRYVSAKGLALFNPSGIPRVIIGIVQDITEREQSEESLKETKRLLSDAEKLGKVGGWEFNIDTLEQKWTEETFHIHEVDITFDNTVEKGVDFYTPDSKPIIKNAVQRAIEFGEPYDLFLKIITAKGNLRHVHTIGKVDLENRRLYGFFQDITERKQAEEALLKSRNLFQHISHISKTGGWNVDLVSGEHNWTEVTREIHEVGPDFVPNMEIAIMFYEEGESREKIKKVVTRCIETGEPFDLEVQIITNKGNKRWVRSMGSADFTDGKCVKLYGTIQDITKYKQEEKELQIKNRISNIFIHSKHENFYKEVLDIFREFFVSEYGYFGYINEKGDLVSESLTKDIWDECQIEDKSIIFPRDKWNGLWGNALKEKKTLYQNGNLQFPGGHVQLQNAIAAPLLTNNKLIGQIALGNKESDFNEIDKQSINKLCDYIAPLLYSKLKENKYKKELLLSKEKAEESERLKSAFLANMSHEIRTPMNGILGFAELLNNPELNDNKQQEYVNIIQKSGTRMLSIINDIIDISKIEAGLMKLDVEETNINEQIEYIYTFFKPEVEAKGMKLIFKTTLSAQEATIKTDREKVYAILINLVKNAIKYSKEGTIKVGYKKRGENLEFYVKDKGIGIPKEKQQSIFERFIQADTDDKMAPEGAGLGLSITKAYLEMLGGEIWVESEEGIGSTFYFTLPYITEPIKETANQQLDTSNKTDPARKLKILIADDDEVSELLLEEELTTVGKEILKAKTGADAVEFCRNNPDIDLVLMDIRMPEMGGYEATQKIRGFNKEVVIIAQTAYGLSGDREKAIEAGCNDYISKPISIAELLALIQKYFG